MRDIRYDKISTYFKLNKKSFILATIAGVIFNGLMAFVPLVQGELINAYKAQKDAKYIILFALSFLAFIVFIQVNRYLKRYFVRDFSNRMVLQMRTVSFQNLIKDDISEFSKTSKGDIMSKTLLDIKDCAEGVRKMLTEVYDSVILMLGYLISMMIMDYKVTLIISIFLSASIIVANLMKKAIFKTTSEYKKTFSKAKDVTLNSLKNEVYYRGFGVSNFYYQKYQDTQDNLEKKSITSMIFKSSLEPTYQAIAFIGMLFVIYMCGKKVIDDVWLIGTFSAFLSTYVLVANKVSKVGKIFNAYTTFKVSWKRCSPYLKSKEKQKEIAYPTDKLDLDVNNLSFGFDKDFVLHNISFHLEKGQSLGICGMIHSGKSTLGAALSGLYNYDGNIKLQGVELKEVRNDIGNNFISYVPSEVEIFNDTIKYNVAFEDKDIFTEMALSCLDQDVNNFENKENEVLSHSTTNLSGGQQKRLQIARSLYNNPKLIVMDDPFNAIDLDMSVKITENIINNYKNSIFVLINNQKEILKKLDYIIFLKNDTYLFGTYDELMKDKDFLNLIGGN
ncbi:MAG: ABC transporter ATP-binding protein/permease [Erysipelotrichaceae bacterium]|nr:ABC transporter ATP-binding protein/permease [Erysipelotrichaceae bacterium]